MLAHLFLRIFKLKVKFNHVQSIYEQDFINN